MTFLAGLRAPILTPPIVAAPVEHFDDFNRANQNLEDDPRYVAGSKSPAGAMTVTNSLLRSSGNGYCYLAATFANDIEVEWSAITGAANNSFFITRVQNDPDDYLGLRMNNTNQQVFTYINGIFTSLLSVGSVSNQQRVRWEIIGNEVRLFRGTDSTTSVGSVTIPDRLLVSGKIGFHSRSSAAMLDNLSIKPRSAFSG